MDIKIFTQILRDKHFTDYKKMKYKYSEDFDDFLNTLAELYYREIPLYDFGGKSVVYIENHAILNQNVIKQMLKPQSQNYGIKSAEEEIIATSAIESIDFSRESVRNILKGRAPADSQEIRIMGIKQGFDFIADTRNKITEENIYKLYMMTAGNFLDSDSRLKNSNYYRHDDVFVVSDRTEHSGLDYRKIQEYMNALIAFANADDGINDLIKAAIIHFYIAWIHPYFDGNGRMARLLHLWFLIQRGYGSTLFVPFSSRIEKSRKAYYDAYTAVEENRKYSGRIDVTPFVLYFADNVYNLTDKNSLSSDTLAAYENAVKSGEVTVKETKLWKFVLSRYGTDEFSTKRLEKDYGDVAYATVRAFVMNFEALGLLSSARYGARIRYRVSD